MTPYSTKKIKREKTQIKWGIFSGIYLIISLLDIIVLSANTPPLYREISKPLILISLMVFYLWQSFPLRERREVFFFLGLIFSFLGDGFLNYEGYFLPGLFSFFTAHIFYVMAFTVKNGIKPLLRNPLTYLTLLYTGLIFNLLQEHLGALKPYVILYMVILFLLVLSVLSRQRSVSQPIYLMGITGAFLFLLSDSVLATHKFAFSIPWAPQIIMATYALAQLLLMRSFLDASGPKN